jgi:surface antigen
MSVAKLSRVIIAIGFASLLPALATAQNYGYLKDSAISNFDEKDVAMLIETVDAALDEQQRHAVREWKNPGTGNSGKAEVLRAFTSAAGTPCKRLQITHVAHNGVRGRASHTFCKETDKWMVVASETK